MALFGACDYNCCRITTLIMCVILRENQAKWCEWCFQNGRSNKQININIWWRRQFVFGLWRYRFILIFFLVLCDFSNKTCHFRWDQTTDTLSDIYFIEVRCTWIAISVIECADPHMHIDKTIFSLFFSSLSEWMGKMCRGARAYLNATGAKNFLNFLLNSILLIFGGWHIAYAHSKLSYSLIVFHYASLY